MPPAPPAAPLPADPNAQLLQQGVDFLVAGDLVGAEALFLRVALSEPDPGRRAFAESLAARTRVIRDARAARPPTLVLPSELPSGAVGASDDQARMPFLVTSALLGVGLYAWALPFALHVESSRLFLGTYLVGAAASFAVPYFVTREHPTSWSQLSLAFWGGTRGAQLGVMLSNLAFGADAGNLLSAESSSEGRALVAAAAIGSLGGLAAGRWLARDFDLTPGGTRLIALGGDVGVLWGFGLGYLLDFDQHRKRKADPGIAGRDGFAVGDSPSERDKRARLMSLSGLVLGVGGILGAGYLGADHARSFSWGDGEVMRAAGIAGAWAGLSAAVAIDEGNTDLGVGLAMLGSAAGLVVGDRLVLDTEFSIGRSIAVDFGTVLGGLAGAGLAVLALDRAEPAPVLVASAVGAAGGFTLTYLGFRERQAPAANAALPNVSLIPILGADGRRGLGLGGVF